MENIRISQDKFRLDAELKNVPISFVNGLRRILLSEIPTVVINNVKILDNTTQMTHEMLKHRVEMLPINVHPTEVETIRDAKIELRYLVSDQSREVTSDDFVVTGAKTSNVFLHDKMLGTPMYFMTLKPSESLHITANLGITTGALSQVCVSTYALHVDPQLAQRNKDAYVSKAGEDKKAQMLAALEFDNLHVQRSYSVDPATDRPNWFDIAIESIGVIPARDLLNMAAQVYKTKIEDWTKTPIQREEGSWYRMEVEGESHTLGALVQEIMYRSGLVEYVSYNIGHPLKPLLTIRFQVNTIQPDDVIERVKLEALALCDNVLK